MKRYWPLPVILAARLWAFHAFPLSAEDAYITFHAAVDPAWMKATTSPLWALLLALGEPQFMSRALVLLADLATAWAVVSRFTPYGAALWTAFWCAPFMVGSAVSGLETHLVADALVCSLASPWGFALACWRPDAVVMSLVASGRRWRYAMAGGLIAMVAGVALSHHLMPQTIGSKLAVYGVHWFKGWYWWHSEGLGWLEIPLIAGAAYYAVLDVVSWCHARFPVSERGVSRSREVSSMPQPLHEEMAQIAGPLLDDRRRTEAKGVRKILRTPRRQTGVDKKGILLGLRLGKIGDAPRRLLQAVRSRMALHPASQGGPSGPQRARYFLVAIAPLFVHFVLGTPNFHWYAVPSAALLCALVCEKLPRGGFVIGLAVLCCFWPGQWRRLHGRAMQEKSLMNLAICLKNQHPQGTIMLEPAGIIPYVNPGLRVVDDVGLTEPWMAKRRQGPPGWMTDAVERYKPNFVVCRVVELEKGKAFAGVGEPYRSPAERDSLTLHYWLGCTSGITFTGDAIHGRPRADVLVILQNKEGPATFH